MIASTGLVLAVVLLSVVAATAYWTQRVHREAARAAQSSQLEAIGVLLSETAGHMLAHGELSQLRLLLSDVGREAGLSVCRIVLPGGGVIADADPSRITVLDLPGAWPPGPAGGAAPPAATDEVAASYGLDVPGRGRAALDLAAPTGDGLEPWWDAQVGVAAIGAAALVALLLVYRQARARVMALGAIREALLALDEGDDDAATLVLDDAMGPEARAWNELLARQETLRKQALGARFEETLAQQTSPKRELQQLCAAMPQGVVLVDDTLHATYANGAAGVLLGSDPAAIVGTSLVDLIRHSGVIEALEAAVADPQRPGTSVELDNRAEGATSVLRFGVRPLRREDASAAMLTIEDVTQQRVAEEARNAFITQVTHELRAPLTNIRISAEAAIEDGEEDPDARARCLNIINQEARRLERVVSDMLSVAEIEAGTLELRRDDVRLDALFEQLEADHANIANEKNITVEFNLPPKLPVIDADREKLGLALYNLVGNAIKYTPAGGRVVVNVDVQDDRLSIDVIDNGIGIAEKDIESIFQKFYRADDERLADITGSGLGLALAQQVVRLHGGEITVESQLDKGSTFGVRLPVVMKKAA